MFFEEFEFWSCNIWAVETKAPINVLYVLIPRLAGLFRVSLGKLCLLFFFLVPSTTSGGMGLSELSRLLNVFSAKFGLVSSLTSPK